MLKQSVQGAVLGDRLKTAFLAHHIDLYRIQDYDTSSVFKL